LIFIGRFSIMKQTDYFNLKGDPMAGTFAHTLKIHLWTLPRWFTAPFFALSAFMGAVLEGSITLNSWLGVAGILLIMAGANSFNSFLDYAWTGLDRGDTGDRSGEKSYTAAQNLVASGTVSLRVVVINALGWYLLALVILVYLAFRSGWPVLLLGCLGMLITFWYSWGKFNWTHELALMMGAGPVSALVGMFATNPEADWAHGILGGIPFGIAISFCGLALDEWADAGSDVKKGVRSLVHKVWEYGVSLEWYLTSWIVFLLLYQVLLIVLGIYKPQTGLTFLTWPLFIACIIFLKRNFRNATNAIILTAFLYFIILTVAQVFG
jgi:1,4-dihydroxy-2-naphthoate octaprenyltransferase